MKCKKGLIYKYACLFGDPAPHDSCELIANCCLVTIMLLLLVGVATVAIGMAYFLFIAVTTGYFDPMYFREKDGFAHFGGMVFWTFGIIGILSGCFVVFTKLTDKTLFLRILESIKNKTCFKIEWEE